MTSKQRKAFGRFFLQIGRSSDAIGEAGLLEIRGVYKEELKKIKKAAEEVVDVLRDGSKDE